MSDISTHSTLTTGLVSYWSLDETSDGSGAVTRVDAHASNDLTDTNTTASATGIISNGADFEASNSEYLSITEGAQSGLDISPDLSISLWLKTESGPSSGSGFSILGKYRGLNGARQYSLSYDNVSGTPKVTWRTSSNGTSVVTGQVSQTFTAGTWYHLALVHDGSAGECIVYVNGSSIGTLTGYASSIVNGTQEFRIGYLQDVAGYFDGVIDEVGIWSKTLTTGEISDLYASGAGLPYSGGGGGTPYRNAIFFGGM